MVMEIINIMMIVMKMIVPDNGINNDERVMKMLMMKMMY